MNEELFAPEQTNPPALTKARLALQKAVTELERLEEIYECNLDEGMDLQPDELRTARHEVASRERAVAKLEAEALKSRDL